MGRPGKRHIVYISGTRADYGLMRETLKAIRAHPRLKLTVVATGMHLMPAFGRTIRDIQKDHFKLYTVPAIFKKDDPASMAAFLGTFSARLVPLLKRIKPDILLLLGDRAEMLAGASVATYLGLPIAHLHGGEVTSMVDEAARHAVTKLAHIHLPATKESARRIVRMGENPKNVFVVGAPGLNAIRKKLTPKRTLEKKYGLDLSQPLILVAQHPVSLEYRQAALQMKNTLAAVRSFKLQTLVVYPNADAGGRSMIREIEKYRRDPHFTICKSLSPPDFLSLMEYALVLVGNSSAGIIEAPSFRLPVVNIGSRQEGRQRAANVIDVGYQVNSITKAIKSALNDKRFRQKIKAGKNPYGDGRTGPRVSGILAGIRLTRTLLQKKTSW